MGFEYVRTGFENGSPAEWRVLPDGTVQIDLIYDHERDSPNRAVLHWHVQLQGTPGTEVNLVLRNFDNIWNGRHGCPVQEETSCCISPDGREWRVVRGRKAAGDVLELRVRLAAGSLYLARIEPYRLSDLGRFLERICDDPRVEIEPVGHTVEGRPLEIVRVGQPEAPFSVFLRGRAHPWETGGSWLLEGLTDRLLREEGAKRGSRPGYCLYFMPMANKDGVARGGSRFNVMGMDLNRKWDCPADPDLAPENAALEAWFERLGRRGRVPDLAIDLHNDAGGKLHVSRPAGDAAGYLENMGRLEQVLRAHTWFTEGSTDPQFRNPGSFGEGLYERYGIDACILELNCNWSAGLNRAPLGRDWHGLGWRLHDAFTAYFDL